MEQTVKKEAKLQAEKAQQREKRIDALVQELRPLIKPKLVDVTKAVAEATRAANVFRTQRTECEGRLKLNREKLSLLNGRLREVGNSQEAENLRAEWAGVQNDLRNDEAWLKRLADNRTSRDAEKNLRRCETEHAEQFLQALSEIRGGVIAKVRAILNEAAEMEDAWSAAAGKFTREFGVVIRGSESNSSFWRSLSRINTFEQKVT